MDWRMITGNWRDTRVTVMPRAKYELYASAAGSPRYGMVWYTRV